VITVAITIITIITTTTVTIIMKKKSSWTFQQQKISPLPKASLSQQITPKQQPKEASEPLSCKDTSPSQPAASSPVPSSARSLSSETDSSQTNSSSSKSQLKSPSTRVVPPSLKSENAVMSFGMNSNSISLTSS